MLNFFLILMVSIFFYFLLFCYYENSKYKFSLKFLALAFGVASNMVILKLDWIEVDWQKALLFTMNLIVALLIIIPKTKKKTDDSQNNTTTEHEITPPIQHKSDNIAENSVKNQILERDPVKSVIINGCERDIKFIGNKERYDIEIPSDNGMCYNFTVENGNIVGLKKIGFKECIYYTKEEI